MIEIMIITASFNSFQLRISIFSDYILKEYICLSENFIDISKKKYELYDIQNEIIHIVPHDTKYRTIIPSSHYQQGRWQSMTTKVSHTDTIYAVFNGYNCLIEKQKRHSITPLGESIIHSITYYADIPSLKKLLDTHIKLAFCGFVSTQYDPYLFEIYQYLEDDDTAIMGETIKTSITQEAASDSIISQILCPPLGADTDQIK